MQIQDRLARDKLIANPVGLTHRFVPRSIQNCQSIYRGHREYTLSGLVARQLTDRELANCKMHVVGLRGLGVRIVTRGNSDSSSSSNPAMAVLKILSILPTPSCAKSIHGMNPKPKLCSARAWSSQVIRADAGAAAISDAASKVRVRSC